MPLPTCNLCRCKPANQTNSHIFSWFLIRDAINKHGVKGRENEVVFSLDGEYVRTYIGREQSAEEHVIPIKGRPLNEQEIRESENDNPFTRDNVLCSECEKKLNVLESQVNNSVISGLRSRNVPADVDFQRTTVNNGDLLRLFIYSLAWRGAIVKINTFEMLPLHQEVLREILVNCLSLDPPSLTQNITAQSAAIRSIPAIIDFMETTARNDNPINCSISYHPYSMQLNDLGFQLYFDDAPRGDDDPLFQEINNAINGDDFIMHNEITLDIALISDRVRQTINKNLYTRMGLETLRKATIKFIRGFIYMLGVMPSDHTIAIFRENLIRRGNERVENYTDHDQFEAAQETMLQLFPYLFR
jgi:hypothetical protein